MLIRIVKSRIGRVKLKKRTITSLLLAFILVTSLLVTGCSKGGSSSTEKSSSSDTIAIVNQDIGVESSGKTFNYSEEFIKTLDKKKYKVVSSASAEEGIKKGTYAGAIFFPSDLSANILNINYQNPQPIKLEYKISNKLNKASHDGTQDRVFETYKKFNDKLAYAYVNAILDEVELGQYNVSAIFNNDGSNLAAARKLASGNYNADFKMPNMPEQNVKYNNQDTRRLAENGKAYAADLNALYKEAYAKNYDTIRDELLSPTLSNAIHDKLNLVEGDIDAAVNYINNVNRYKEAVAKYKEEVDKYLATGTNRADLDAARTKVDDAERIVTDSAPSSSNIANHKTDLVNAVRNYQGTMGDLSSKLSPETMTRNSNAGVSSSGATYEKAIKYRMDDFLQILNSTTEQLNSVQNENVSKLTAAYSENSKFTMDTVKVMNETNAKNHAALDASVNAFNRTAEANSLDTKTRLKAFSEILSNAKVEGRVSSDVIKFLIQPTMLVEKK